MSSLDSRFDANAMVVDGVMWGNQRAVRRSEEIRDGGGHVAEAAKIADTTTAMRVKERFFERARHLSVFPLPSFLYSPFGLCLAKLSFGMNGKMLSMRSGESAGGGRTKVVQ
jgi:hypothetical protein